MNFGPLNRDGGWRRLNVAVTRARYEMHIFASLKTDQIDLSRTSSDGVAGLKAFLNFAEKGHLAIPSTDLQVTHDKQHLSETIGQRLQKKGLTVKSNIGTSGYKVDIGIVHPDNPHQYLMGIILDGYYYYNARTANDREMVMPSVLISLGWNIYRIWTMDWYENSDKIVDAILAEVSKLQNQPHTEPEEIVIPEPVLQASFELVRALPGEPGLPAKTTRQKPYLVCALTPVQNASGEMIFDFQHRNLIKQQIRQVVETEAPISKSMLYKKVLQAWNISRAGSRLDKHLESIINEANISLTLHHQPFYCITNNAGQLDFYRSNDTEKRNIDDIAPEEIMVALHEAVAHNLSIEEEELLRYIARTFGFAKVGKQIDTLVRYALDLTLLDGKVKKENGRIKAVN